jgi:hypothetical protein
VLYNQNERLLASGTTIASINTMIITAEMIFLFLPELKNLNINFTPHFLKGYYK